MADLLRVKDWGRLYENSRTRQIEHLAWVPIPNKMDGYGYITLISHPDGPAHFGAWVAIIEIASKCQPRGTLVSGTGQAHDARSLAMISRIPVETLDATIPRLLQIGWLELVPGGCQAGDTLVSCGCQSPDIELNRTELNRTESFLVNSVDRENEADHETISEQPTLQHPGPDKKSEKPKKPKHDSDVQAWFDAEFWPVYPRHIAKEAARTAADRAAAEPMFRPAIIAGLRNSLPTLTRDGGQFCPYPATWLNGRRWEDEPTAEAENGIAEAVRRSFEKGS